MTQNALEGSYFEFLNLFVPATLLGYILGMFTVWPCIRKLCSKINGAPLQIGDRVQVLKGRYKGKVCEVYETPKGQGGRYLARIEMGVDLKSKYQDIFEQYSLLKVT